MSDESDSSGPSLADVTPQWLAMMGFGGRPQPTRPMGTTEKPKRANSLTSRGAQPLPPDVLRVGQLRVLAALIEVEADSGSSAITIDQIANTARISVQTVKNSLGAVKAANRDSHDESVGFLSLISRGLVIVIQAEKQSLYYLSQLGILKADDLEDTLIELKKTKPMAGRPKTKVRPETPKKRQRSKNGKRIKKNVEKVIITPTEL